MTYGCPNWEYAAYAHLLKLHRLQNNAVRVIGNLDRCTPVRELHVAFNIPYVYGCVTEECRIPSGAILSHVNPNVLEIGQGEIRYRKYKRLKFGGGQAYNRSTN
jgi:hypothetical protein